MLSVESGANVVSGILNSQVFFKKLLKKFDVAYWRWPRLPRCGYLVAMVDLLHASGTMFGNSAMKEWD
jgi:hypothetical protein